MGVHCPSLRDPYPTVRPIPLYHGTGGTVHGSPLSLLRGPISHCLSYPTVYTMGQVGLSMGVHCPSLGTQYPTVCPIPLYHGTGGTVHVSPLSLLRGPISHCPSYPTVPWDRWECPWESTVLSEPHYVLFLSHALNSKVYSVLW